MTVPAELKPTLELVEKSLEKLGHEPQRLRIPDRLHWRYDHGSAQVNIELFQMTESTTWYCRVSSPFMPLPALERRLEFYEQLLRLNMQYPAIAFALEAEQIYLKSEREIRGMDLRELSMMLHRIALISDHYDDLLRSRYLD